MDYIRAMEKVNQKKNFRTMNEYLDLVSTEIYRKYPHSSVKGHKKQLGYVLRWMKDDRLKIIGDFSANGLEIHISLFLK
ncbi:unnamed protein product [marine sediment metagenome]|uniref:Uncharacterized protein n=1 Tax=marine sediment metagenome TaxID=412755 RepID=X1HHU5_9ZZZZ